MSIESTINGFYSSVKKAGELLSNYRNEIDDKQEKIKACISGISPESESGFDSGNEIDTLCKKQIFQYNKAISSWQKTVSSYIDGKEFVNKFEKSLLMIVFADVNAGKSSLGNFVSGYSFKDTPYGGLYSKPKCYSYDYADKTLDCGKEIEIAEGNFAEAAVQATSSIQYFTLFNGLTWVDTPGIHSLSTEYEQLAKDYVKYADLILFLTPSANPWKQDEAQEVEKLVNSGKPMLIAITKSDKYKVQGIVNGKPNSVPIPKDDKDRTSQENYVREEISKLHRSDIVGQREYISISTLLANTAMSGQNEEMFVQSNFPRFFEQIGSVISEKAVELKMQRPRDELNSVIVELISGNDTNGFIGIDALSDNIKDSQKKVAESANRISQLNTVILSNVKGKISNDIYSLLCAKKNGGLDDTETISKEIGKIINRNLNTEIARTVGNEISNLEVHLASDDILIDAHFEKRSQTIEYETYEAGNHHRDPKGLFEQIAAFFGKEFTEFSVITRKHTKEIQVGDNFNEYADSVWMSSLPFIEERTNNEIERIKQAYYGKLCDALSSMLEKLNFARGELESLKY